ncbi:hypothetical protein SCMC78_00750 [Streptomyces sp. CMC78]|uniref:Uncharacterized protein n=1 Tax=Streptomyces sp. CMC78 TaxID=3231512 RepID=A0AB33KEK4_9ACTN
MWPLRRSTAAPWRCPDRQAPPSTEEGGGDGRGGTAPACPLCPVDGVDGVVGMAGVSGVRAWARPPPVARRADARTVDRNRAAL